MESSVWRGSLPVNMWGPLWLGWTMGLWGLHQYAGPLVRRDSESMCGPSEA